MIRLKHFVGEMLRNHHREHRTMSDNFDRATAQLEHRLEGMNEFRDQLREQAAQFLQRDRFEAEIKHLRTEMDQVRRLVWMAVGAVSFLGVVLPMVAALLIVLI